MSEQQTITDAGQLEDAGQSDWAGRHFVMLAVLGAFGTLFHQAQWHTYTATYGQMIATLGAVLILCRPTSIWRWALMHVGVILEVLMIMPFASNHIFFHMMLSGSMIAAIGWTYIANGFKPMTRGQVFEAAAPIGRVMVIVLYFFTWWHKTNWAFFNPEISCGTEFYRLLQDKAFFLPEYADWMAWPSIIGVILMEMALFFTLIFTRVRAWGIFIVLFFHGLVGAINHPNFSAIAFGYMVLFLPKEASGVLVQRWRDWTAAKLKMNWSERGPVWRKRLVLLGWAGTAAAIGWAAYAATLVIPNNPVDISLLREPWNDPVNWLQRNIKRVFMVYGPIVFWGVYFVALWKCGWTWPKPYFRIPQKWLYAFPVLLFCIAMNPYFSGRTDCSMSMFSNLITEDGHQNHVFLSWVPKFNDLQEDRVTLVATDDPELANLMGRQYALHWFELQRYVQRKVAVGQGDFSVTYRRGGDMLGLVELDQDKGELFVVESAGQDPDLNEPIPYLMWKYMYLRPFRYGELNSCDH